MAAIEFVVRSHAPFFVCLFVCSLVVGAAAAAPAGACGWKNY